MNGQHPLEYHKGMVMCFKPVIPSILSTGQIPQVCRCVCDRVNLMTGSVTTLRAHIELLHSHEKKVYVHIEMIERLARDVEAVKFVVKGLGADGIISTKNMLIAAANDLGCPTIQRIFAIDTAAVTMSFKAIERNDPTEIERMPGLMPEMIALTKKSFSNKLLITGGLVRSAKQVKTALKSGADFVSASFEKLWFLSSYDTE